MLELQSGSVLVFRVLLFVLEAIEGSDRSVVKDFSD